MSHGVLTLLAITCGIAAEGTATAQAPKIERDRSLAEVSFYDRLHQTFLHLNEVAIAAYLDHFRDEPAKLAVVQFYAGRLAESRHDALKATEHFQKSSELSGRTNAPQSERTETTEDASPQQRMIAARAAIHQAGQPAEQWTTDPVQILEYQLGTLGPKPHVVLQRAGGTAEQPAARCPLYDPELLWAHRRLWELKNKTPPMNEPANVRESLATVHLAIRALRGQPEHRELSLRKFLDKYRVVVWGLGWLYRCLGVEQEQAAELTAARESYLRAWAIGDALFPASERGRMDRMDPIFLVELGDVYARLGRYDLMLRYMYSEQGLPAQYEMAQPVADLARVAESIRLMRSDEKPAEMLDEVMPETVSQILFDQPLVPHPAGEVVAVASSSGSIKLGWVITGSGGILLLAAIAWGLSRAARRLV